MKQLRFRHWGREHQTVYDLAEKHDFSLDLIEKNLGENDLVYELTEIDIWPSGFQFTFRRAPMPDSTSMDSLP